MVAITYFDWLLAFQRRQVWMAGMGIPPPPVQLL